MGQDFRSSDLDGVSIHSTLIGEGVKGFTYVSGKGKPHMFISDSLSPESTAETIAHETYHIKHEKLSYRIGLDMHFHKSELKANNFATRNAHRVLMLMGSTTAT